MPALVLLHFLVDFREGTFNVNTRTTIRVLVQTYKSPKFVFKKPWTTENKLSSPALKYIFDTLHLYEQRILLDNLLTEVASPVKTTMQRNENTKGTCR